MRDIASITQVTPNQRVAAMRKFISNVNDTPDAKALLDGWGIQLQSDVIRFEGRVLPNEVIKVGDGKTITDISSDFSKKLDKSQMFEVVDLKNWIIMYTRQDVKTKSSFVSLIQRCAGPMGMLVNRPTEVELPDDHNGTYASYLRKRLESGTQIAVFICPTSRDDRYAIIKKICCHEKPVASQVINSRTLRNEEKNRLLVQKILMQMNCKLGGSLWSIEIPFKINVMICGIDTFHDSVKKAKSVSAFVASINNTYTRWYSKATIQSSGEELTHGLVISLQNALITYKKFNNCLPDRIILFR